MHIVYVMSASEHDHFAELTAISLASVRLSHPLVQITVVTDQPTLSIGSAAVRYVTRQANNLIESNSPSSSPFERSRYLKCHLGQLINGPFLYVDSDTLILSGLDDLSSLDCDIAAAPDLNRLGRRYPCHDLASRYFHPMNWETPTGLYLNSGVIYFSGSPASEKISEEYVRAWYDYSETTGKFNDQPAFNHATYQASPRLTVLSNRFNAQISMNPLAARNARIVHFFTEGFETSDATVAHVLAKQMKTSGTFDASTLASAIGARNPWTHINSIKKAVATKQPTRLIVRLAKESLLRRLSWS